MVEGANGAGRPLAHGCSRPASTWCTFRPSSRPGSDRGKPKRRGAGRGSLCRCRREDPARRATPRRGFCSAPVGRVPISAWYAQGTHANERRPLTTKVVERRFRRSKSASVNRRGAGPALTRCRSSRMTRLTCENSRKVQPPCHIGSRAQHPGPGRRSGLRNVRRSSFVHQRREQRSSRLVETPWQSPENEWSRKLPQTIPSRRRSREPRFRDLWITPGGGAQVVQREMR